MIALTTEEFIRRAKEIHGNKFDYSKAIYINSKTKLTIICCSHGAFKQLPSNHINGQECPKCAEEKRSLLFRLPLTKFIEKASKLHNDKYDYSEVMYTNNRDMIIISCPKHGKFKQLVLGHLQGYGCYKCGNETRTYLTEDFIKKAKIKHGDKYDYSKVMYVHSKNKVTIICPEHGEFEQIANAHLYGSICPRCSNDDRKLTQKEFIKRGKQIHGDKYDYSKVEYKGCRDKVIITCLTHGDFKQNPNSHLSNKSGCPYCFASKGESTIETILTKHGISYTREYKIPGTNYRFKYDFYLPEYKLLIEFQGIQHYKAIPYFGGEDNFQYIKRNDLFKKALAREVKLRLIEFNYKQLKHLNEEQFEKLVLNSINRHK